MRRRVVIRRQCAALLAAAGVVAAVGCGDSSSPEQRSARYERPQALPLEQYALAQYVCPRSAGVTDRLEVAKLERRGGAMLNALIAALRDNPGAKVETRVTPSDGGGVVREMRSIRELAQTHLDGLDGGTGIRDADCLERTRHRLTRALEGE